MIKLNFLKRNVAKMTVACLVVAAVFISCEKDKSSGGSIGGSQSPIGEEGNTFSLIGSISGVSNVLARIVDLDDGVSTISASVNISNSTYLDLIKDAFNSGIFTGGDVSGTKVSGELRFRITDAGIQSVLPDGKLLTVIKYNAKKGDVYTVKQGSRTIRREVTNVSDENDFPWGGMNIKTITAKETGRGTPGIDYMEYRCNHRFGLVAVKLFFEDGTSLSIPLSSGATN